MVEYFACTEDTRVRFAAGPLPLGKLYSPPLENESAELALKKTDDEPSSSNWLGEFENDG